MACSVAAGATADGVCTGLTGNVCNDFNLCTLNDVCKAGVCTAGAPTECPPSDECHAEGTCGQQDGICQITFQPNGTPCTGGACFGGVCSIFGSGASSSGSSGSAGSGSSSGVGGGGGGSGGGNGKGGNDATGSSAMASSTAASSGTAGAGGSAEPGPSDEPGCGCRFASEPGPGASLIGLALLPLLRRRRRR